MNFLSVEFCFFFLALFLVYWLVSPWVKIQNALLLITGYVLVYLSGWQSLVVLLLFSVSVWCLLTLSCQFHFKKIIPFLLILFIAVFFLLFKYYTGLRDGVQSLLVACHIPLSLPVLNVLLPVGLSFYLFNAVSLVMSAAQGKMKQPSLPDTLLYLNFFPTLLAGPVNRALHLMPQIARSTPRQLQSWPRALFLISLAIAKLFFLNTWLDEHYVAPAFGDQASYTGWQAVIATYAWAWQIYFNFSGYTNLVTGIALLLGFEAAKNFDHPYLAENIKVFWHRWHISLSSFIRDYVYFPLGGSRHGWWKTQRNLLIAMVLSGIWHGTSMNYMVWGAIHGAGLVAYNGWSKLGWLSRLPEKYQPAIRLPLLSGAIARLLTFHFVCLAWIFFRADSLGSALTMLSVIAQARIAELSVSEMATLGFFLSLLVFYPIWLTLRQTLKEVLAQCEWYVVPVMIFSFLALVFFLSPAGVPGFIYANF
ncbi:MULTISPECIES: MBOAT family O-acyltransferase [Dickeya]|uniref:Probable alginate O-acetylase n=1 Tax=Dickeya aquatica TaxID=1401087 RepID=A0A375AGM2_9GAMM|nr:MULTISPECIES: MBOAT family O-acyltransferase [Dickeya]SLM65167.1 Probable poly(beta-D-mannuronate) O-acetylase [Dickeya aquatica]